MIMWTRRELKEKGKFAFKQNYWKAVLVAILFTLVVGGMGSAGGSSFGSGVSEGMSEAAEEAKSETDDVLDGVDDYYDGEDSYEDEATAEDDTDAQQKGEQYSIYIYPYNEVLGSKTAVNKVLKSVNVNTALA